MRTSINPRIATLLAVAGLIFATVVSACGDDDSVSQEELQQATKEAASEARQQAESKAELDELREQVEALQEDKDADPSSGTPAPAPSSSGIPADAESCGAGVYARSGTTSCSFALNVASDYYASPGNTFTSFSPTTGKTYTMSCSGVAPVVCTGGNDAAVYLP